MDRHVKLFYRRSTDKEPGGTFHEVIPLHEAPDTPWEEITKRVPSLPRGWYELAQLPVRDRIEFCRDFWLSQFPCHRGLNDFLYRFFASLDDIGIFITQRKWEDPFQVDMVYSLADDCGYYRGSLPSKEEELTHLQGLFPDYTLPRDYLAFVKMHDGFCKATDCTGITPISKMYEEYKRFQQLISKESSVTTSKGKSVNPKSLIPFYESFGEPFFQCFWGEWYPQDEMGNVYYSHATNTISDVNCKDPSSETMAFSTFIDWLIFYLERVE